MGCDCAMNCAGILTPEIKKVISESPFLALNTMSKDGQPHLIVVGKAKEIRDDDALVFGVYKMVKTRRNLSETGVMQVVAASVKSREEAHGYRLSGRAVAEDNEVLFKVEKADILL
ncbi:pyridoxamine 5'-phosphate oxidase family protein [Desulfotomaculum copahuensis]|uniref:Pyridoxamine 5-phosphate oxidase n=1 Tax=Desulfotomaculum copahuensis TaxID=1838280 RepID=A0A1B7LEN9_9FIRM|nr:pyridoxamine 5'-phosphate oxidase family protein [Desulfotomaculum copahuensis]OAT81755.1 pyridoxamine 5-phosphate oxidase [Desulfotomaculum copahuensis]